jgi:hypothetical protein
MKKITHGTSALPVRAARSSKFEVRSLKFEV